MVVAVKFAKWSDLYRLVMTSCQPYATPSRFNERMKYLLKKGYIEKVDKGICEITESGMKYLETPGKRLKADT